MRASLPPATAQRLSLLILKRSMGPFSPCRGVVCCERDEGEGCQGWNKHEEEAAGAREFDSRVDIDIRPSLLMHITRVPESVAQVSMPWLAPQPDGIAGPSTDFASTSYSCTMPLLLHAAATSPRADAQCDNISMDEKRGPQQVDLVSKQS